MPDGNAGGTSQQPDGNAASQADSAASRLPPLSQAPLLAVKSNDLRELVLEYLSHSCYVDSAVAFAREWDKAEGTSAASSSGPSLTGPSAGPSTSRYEGSLDTASAGQSSSALGGHDRDDGDDTMMQSVHGDFHNQPYTSNGHAATSENGDAAYQDRHHHYRDYKHLSAEQIEHIRARKGTRLPLV